MTEKKNWVQEYFSIPNLMGYFRIVLAVVYLLVCFRAESVQEYRLAAAVIAVSMLTDFLDGKIARAFHMITDWGKMLDPVADKITLGVVALSFIWRYPFAEKVVFLFAVKELFMAVSGLLLMRKGWRTEGALFCGKVCTALMYGISVLLLLFPDMGILFVNLLFLAELGIMLVTLVLYARLYLCAALRLRRGIPAESLTLKGIQKELRERRKGWRKFLIPAAAAVVVVYLLVGAIYPFSIQPEVSQEQKDSFRAEDYYGEGEGADRARIISENGEALDTRISMISHAKERVILSTFDFRTDEAGLDMLAVLYDAANRGVQVEIFADGFNSWLRMEGNAYFYALSSSPNVKITIYNKVNLCRPWTIMGRMHDKYVIVDDTAYLLGGRNTFGYFLGDYEGHKNYDWDVLVYNTGAEDASGSSLAQLLEYYERITAQSSCSVFHDGEAIADKPSVKHAAGVLTARLEALKETSPELFAAEYEYAEKTEPTEKVSLLSNPVNILAKEPVVFYQLMQLAEHARESVNIHTPYIMCSDAMYAAFTSLGDKVTLMLNSAANNGNPFAAVDYMMEKQKLIDTGMNILEYEGGISYHGKVITMDDDLALVGSFNMDMRSAYIDTELMVVIDSPAVNQTLRAQMEQYETDAAEVETVDTYRRIPEGMTMQPVDFQKKFLKNALGWLQERLRFLL